MVYGTRARRAYARRPLLRVRAVARLRARNLRAAYIPPRVRWAPAVRRGSMFRR